MVFQHVGHEPLGSLNPMLKAAGFRIRYVNFGRHPDMVPDLEGYNGLVVLGGPMGVYEADQFPHLKVEMQAIEHALKNEIPVLGICLGSQLLAQALGGRVYKADTMELGWHKIALTPHGEQDPLFSTFEKSESIFQLHQDTFTLPQNAFHLALSQICENQAFRYGEKVYGFQFHLEVDRAMILRWLRIPDNRKMIERSNGLYSVEQIERETELNIQRSLDLSQKAFRKFIDLFQLPERGELLGSGHGKPRKME